ncbi:MAG TPA: polyphosphate kinase 2 family protein [Micromonosporaceae bacterium]|nr:polyphosphate kinase 2 family protein [Micromonosporaceae bacterium]
MSLRDVLRVDPGARVDLASIDPDGTPGLPRRNKVDKQWGRAQLDVLGLELASLQERLFATAKVAGSQRRVLLVLQAMDCGGKDGTVRKVAGTMNPQGLTVVGFGKPTEDELAHDFLWRIAKALPPAGQIGVFNRSHYEDVLVARVHKLVPRRTWQARYSKINQFEAAQAAAGTTILKVMLHISPEEQRERLLERLADPTRYWKYNPADINERALWDDYQAAYADALSACSTAVAPWYVVPANRKWYRDWAVATLLRDTIADLDLQYPPADFDVATERARLG